MPKPEGRPELQATEIKGMNKEARQSRAVVLAGLMMQTKLLMLSAPGGDGKTTIYAVIVGEDKNDGDFLHDLKESFHTRPLFQRECEHRWRLVEEVAALKRGPDLSPGMADPVWVGRCRGCGEIVGGVVDDRDGRGGTAEIVRAEIGRMVVRGDLVERVPGPIAVGPCRCEGGGAS